MSDEPDELILSGSLEETQSAEAEFLAKIFVCQKCGGFHSRGGDDLSGQVCCPIPCKYQCDGVLRRTTLDDIPGKKS